MKGVWIHTPGGMNETVGFLLDLQEPRTFSLTLAAGSVFKLYVDGEAVFFGPMRAAHGYARRHHMTCTGRHIAVVVNHPGIRTFCWLCEDPFFACTVVAGDKTWHTDDFTAYALDERVREVLRYSYQRGFSEVYRVNGAFPAFLAGHPTSAPLAVREVPLPELLECHTHAPTMTVVTPRAGIASGYIADTGCHEVPYQRYFDLVGTVLDGFRTDSVSDNQIADYVAFRHAKEPTDTGLVYRIFAFDGSRTGFLRLRVRAKSACAIRLAYEELIDDKDGDLLLHPLRNETLNVVKWTLERGGNYDLSTFEPYTAQYAEVIFPADADVELSLVEYVNPDAGKLDFHCEDEDLNLIVRAARESFRSNAVDLLTDCPSRERSGWLSDSYFSGTAERLFTGENLVEAAFLENYALSDRSAFPAGMIPMNYPSDAYDGTYIPNWSMWYVMEILRIAHTHPDSDTIRQARGTIEGLFAFFARYENEYSLLENLESWVFVEWSAANNADHIAGVNIPSNICYHRILIDAGRLYDRPDWVEKGERIRENILHLGFNGTLFVDNLLRDEKGVLQKTDHLTEVCQYYAFWFGAVTPGDHPALYDLLMHRLGRNKAPGFMDNVEKPNMMYGIYMRLDLLMREGKREELLDEIRYYFLPMAKTTGTLWEHTSTHASLNHAFASYSIKWILYATTGYNADTDRFESLPPSPVIPRTVCSLPFTPGGNSPGERRGKTEGKNGTWLAGSAY